MNVYRGTVRRQVAGGVWTTVWLGLKPVIKKTLVGMLPLGKAVAKRAASSALNVGSNLAADAITGRLSRNTVKERVQNEANVLKDEGFAQLKRRLGIQEGEGVHAKRRRVSSKKSKRKTRKRNVNKRKTSSKRKTTSKRKVVPKRKRPLKLKIRKNKKSKKGINSGSVTKKKNTSSSVSHKAIRDLFGK